MDILGFHLPGLTAVVATFTAVYGAFARFDGDQSDENRQFVRSWLLGLKVKPEGWQSVFTEIFSKFFGPKHWSLKCLMRSLLLTFFVILVLSLMYGPGAKETWSGTQWHATRVGGLSSGVSDFFRFLPLAILPFLSACFADYFSLWKTRFFLTRKALLNNPVTAIGVVLIDAVATLAILYLAWILLLVADLVILAISDIDLTLVIEGKRDPGDQPNIYLLLATLFTSAWLWIYLIVLYGMRIVSYVPAGLMALSKVMDFEKHPMRTVGYIVAAICAVVVAIGAFV
jgi:hypothetical protein